MNKIGKQFSILLVDYEQNYQSAMTSLIQCLALKPFKPSTLNLLAQLCQRQILFQKSLYDQSLKAQQNNYITLLIKAQILMELKQFQESLTILKDDYTTTHYTISMLYAMLNDKENNNIMIKKPIS